MCCIHICLILRGVSKSACDQCMSGVSACSLEKRESCSGQAGARSEDATSSVVPLEGKAALAGRPARFYRVIRRVRAYGIGERYYHSVRRGTAGETRFLVRTRDGGVADGSPEIVTKSDEASSAGCRIASR